MKSLLSNPEWHRISIYRVRIPQLALTAFWAVAIAHLASGTDGLSARWVAGFLLGSAASMAGTASQPRWNWLGIASLALIFMLLAADTVMNGILNGAWARSSSDDRETTIFTLGVIPACVALALWLRPADAAHRGQRAVAWAAFAWGVILIAANAVAIVFAATGTTMPNSWPEGAEWIASGPIWLQRPGAQLFDTLAAWPTTSLVIAPFAFLGLAWCDRRCVAGRTSRLNGALAAAAVIVLMGTIVAMIAMVGASAIRMPEPNRAMTVLLGNLLGYVIGIGIVWRWNKRHHVAFRTSQRGSATLPIEVARAVSAMREKGA